MEYTPAALQASIAKLEFITHVAPAEWPRWTGLPLGDAIAFGIDASYEAEEWRLLIRIPRGFPRELPQIYLRDPKNSKPFGHLSWNGGICYKDSQGLVANIRDPLAVLHGCIVEALDTLREHAYDGSYSALHEEFEDYWESQNFGSGTTLCFLEPGKSFEVLTAYRDSKNERKTPITGLFAISQKPDIEDSLYTPLRLLKNKKRSQIPYLHLAQAPLPPGPLTVWTAREVFDVLQQHSDSDEFQAFLSWVESQKWSNYFPLLLAHNRPDGGIVLWGMYFTRKDKARHPMVDTDTNWQVWPMHPRLQSPSYLATRGGAIGSQAGKRVAVIGCGSVGGHIAINLAKTGVGELILVDQDVFSPENIYRHGLGGNYIHPTNEFSKVHALNLDICFNLPQMKVTPIVGELDNFAKKFDLNDYDAIVCATGDFISELSFNEIHHQLQVTTPVIYVWQEGFGIGGHAMQVADPMGAGCLECLYTKSVGFRPHQKTNFIAEGQTITQHLGGCSGAFTPYSYVDAVQTAVLATRAVLHVLGGEKTNMLHSWAGPVAELEGHGYNTSKWYETYTNTKDIDAACFIAPNCAVCGPDDPV